MEIRELMDKNPLTVEEEDFLTYARQLIRDNKLRSLPVLNEKKRVKGVLTREGVLNITSNKSNVEVKSYVRNIPTVMPNDSVKKAGIEMIKANIDSLPVVESPQTPYLEGVVTFVDIFNSLKHINVDSRDSVGSVMSENVEVVSADTSIQTCWRKILETGFSSFPVVKKNRLIGIVTRGDILNAGYARFKREDDSQNVGKNSPPVERIMSTPIYTVNKETRVKEASEILLEKNIGRLPVVSKENENNLVGIVDRYDILNSYLR